MPERSRLKKKATFDPLDKVRYTPRQVPHTLFVEEPEGCRNSAVILSLGFGIGCDKLISM